MIKEEILQKVKDKVARDWGFLGMHHLIVSNRLNDAVINEVANRYAIACCEEQKKHDYKVASKRTTEYCGLCVKPLKGDYNNILNTKNVAE